MPSTPRAFQVARGNAVRLVGGLASGSPRSRGGGLIAGLTLVVGMMLTLMGGSIFGLQAFHASNLKLVDQLHELGASKELLQVVVPLESLGDVDTPAERLDLKDKVHKAQEGPCSTIMPGSGRTRPKGAGPTTAATSSVWLS